MKLSIPRLHGLCAGLAAIALTASIAAAQNAATSSNDKQQAQDVLSKMHDVNQMEIKMGDLGMRKGHSRAVKLFARKMRSDHRLNDRKVVALAKLEKLQLANTPPADHPDLESATGADFDRAFMKAMEQGHSDAVQMLTQARTSVQDRRVKRLVGSTIPAVERHLRQAKKIEQTL